MTHPLLAPALAAALWLAAGAAHAVTCQNNIPPSNPDSVYTNNGNGTVTDTRTGLMWKQCLEGFGGANCAADGSTTTFNWANALDHAENHTFAGDSDWRLPNLKELRSLVEECRSQPAINDAVFPNTPLSVVWSGSPLAGYENGAWYVNFGLGYANANPRSVDNHVRLVRGGQSLAPLPALSALALSGTPTASGAALVGTSNLAGSGYWVVVPQGSAAPTPAQVKAQAAYGGIALAAQGSAPMALNTPQTFAVSSLAASTAYDFYLVVQSESNGPLSALGKVSFTTAAVPVVHGSCGTAHTSASATAPVSALCSAGTATSVTGSSGAWGWSCEGSGGASTATCSAPYASQTLTLSANPVSLWLGGTSAITASSSAGLPVSLAGNSHCSVSGTTATATAVGTCTVTASQTGTGDVGAQRYLPAPDKTVDITVSAVPTYTITATANPAAGGTVSCSPLSVTHAGTSTCTATAKPGYSFSGFSGDCTGPTCTLSSVTAAKSVTANFTQNSYAITATANPAAGGTVSCSPATVDHGGSSTCTATANANYRFSAWTGACASQSATCTLSDVQAAQAATAVFANEITIPEGPQTGQAIAVTPPAQNNWFITSASTARTSSIASAPPSTVELPYGIVSLQLTGGPAASTATVVLTYPEPLPAGATYYKYGKTKANPTDHWYEFGGAVISGNTVTLTLTDGGAGDSDLLANGEISDPGGPALRTLPTAAQPIPTLSEWAMLLLAGLLGLLATAAMRRSKA